MMLLDRGERGPSTAGLQKVLFVHNSYQQRGGEDSVVEAEIALLREKGHEVLTYGRHNDELKEAGKAALVMDTIWSRRTTNDVAGILKLHRPDVIHVHNTFPLISPSLYWAADQARIPVVQTLHNFRLLCPQAMLLRDGKVCEDCLGKTPLRGVMHACYRGSVAQTGVLAGMLMAHRTLGTFQHKVARFIALNKFCRDKFVEGGLPASRFSIKPNFIDGGTRPDESHRSGGLFVGRLSDEKGVDVLASASRRAGVLGFKVVGGGELQALAESAFGEGYLGFCGLEQILHLMRTASYLVVPSVWYENFPRTIVEAYASGLPVIASRLGALAEIVDDGRTGLLFEPGNADDLAAKLRWAEEHPVEMANMGRQARLVYETRYTPERNYVELMQIYEEAIGAVNDAA